MPSIGHIAVGLAAARAYQRKRAATPRQLGWSMVAFSVVSALPDADAIGFALGIDYGAPLGHRGASHSIVFGLLVGLVAGLLGRWLGQPGLRVWAVATVTAVSHGLLDTLTNGGLGCALLWPFSNERFFAPLRPIPVAPIGLYLFSVHGVMVVAVELLLFAPFFLYGTFPRRRA